MVAILSGNSKGDMLRIWFDAQVSFVFAVVIAMKRGGLWMVRYFFCVAGRDKATFSVG